MRMRIRHSAIYGGLITSLVVSSIAMASPGDRTEPLPDALEGVGITEKLGAQIPLDLPFVTADGRTVTLKELRSNDRPTLLTLNYSDCPMLCNLQLSGLVEAMKGLEWTAGQEYDVITVSLDPHESSERARKTKERYLETYGRPAQEGWHFLVGEETHIRRLADSVGFGYRYLESEKEYAHAAVVIVLSPSGRVSRYLPGVTYSPQTLRLSMVEASEGKQVSGLDSFVLYCFKYDSTAGTYTPIVSNLMKVGGALTVIALGLFVGAGVVRRKIQHSGHEPEDGVQSDVAIV